jgi:hypothetical protein
MLAVVVFSPPRSHEGILGFGCVVQNLVIVSVLELCSEAETKVSGHTEKGKRRWRGSERIYTYTHVRTHAITRLTCHSKTSLLVTFWSESRRIVPPLQHRKPPEYALMSHDGLTL